MSIKMKAIMHYWPIALLIITALVWMIRAETVSPSNFNTLKTRVTVVEENMPGKDVMLSIQSNQAVMKSQLERIALFTDSMMSRLISMGQEMSKEHTSG